MRPFLTIVLFPALLIRGPGQTSPSDITLQLTRKVLSDRVSSGSPHALGIISLKAFDFSREIEVGRGIRAIAISCQWNGGLVAFHADGSLIQMIQIGPVSSLQLVDLDEDGVSEIITEEEEGHGTGVLKKTFNLYTISDKGINNVWKAQSYSFKAPLGGRPDRVTGFLRFDRSAFGEKARLTYLLTALDGTVLKREIYGMKRGHLILFTGTFRKSP